MDFTTKIATQLRDVLNSNITGEQKTVLLKIIEATKYGRYITQREIAENTLLGSHPNWETAKSESTLRKVRQLVRELRIQHHTPILSTRAGYKIIETEREAMDFIQGLETAVKANAKAYYETYKSMRYLTNQTSNLLEQLYGDNL